MGGNGRPSQHGDMLVPPFYGTGDMLSWNTEDLLCGIDRPGLFTEYWKLLQAPDQAGLDDELERLSRRVREEELIDPRGYYSFFPVIVEGERVIVLDTSDFHTEITSLHLPATESAGPGGLAGSIRPEGATIAIIAVTLGPGLERCAEAAGEHTAMRLLGLGDYLVDDLARRAAVEIRRALFLPADQGGHYPVGGPELPGEHNAPAIAHLVCTEDRLGLTATPGGILHPASSRLCLYLPYGPRRVESVVGGG